MSKYKHLFFDLDHTLWDFERNSAECLLEIYETFSLKDLELHNSDIFVNTFIRINHALWTDFDKGKITHTYIREHRFRLVFEALEVKNAPDGLAMSTEYLRLLPEKSHLLDGALEVLEHCQKKGYKMHIVSNGFDDIQIRKMDNSGITKFFSNIITNEKAGAKKPDNQIFAYSLAVANAQKNESLMIGDNWEADVMGAMRFGIDAVYYNPKALPYPTAVTYEIDHLKELLQIL